MRSTASKGSCRWEEGAKRVWKNCRRTGEVPNPFAEELPQLQVNGNRKGKKAAGQRGKSDKTATTTMAQQHSWAEMKCRSKVELDQVGGMDMDMWAWSRG